LIKCGARNGVSCLKTGDIEITFAHGQRRVRRSPAIEPDEVVMPNDGQPTGSVDQELLQKAKEYDEWADDTAQVAQEPFAESEE